MLGDRPRNRTLPPSPFCGVSYIDSADKLLAAVQLLRVQPRDTIRVVDTETTGCKLFEDRLKVVQIGVSGLPIYVIQIERVDEADWEPLREYLAEKRPNLLQNGKFDLKMLAAAGLTLRGNVHDTCLRSKVYHLGNKQSKHNLKALVDDWCGYSINKEAAQTFVADHSRETLSQKQIAYAANDCVYTHAVSIRQTEGLARRESDQPGCHAHVTREERLLPILADMEVRGFLLNDLAVQNLEAQIKQAMEALEQELNPLLSPGLQQIKLRLGAKPPFHPSKIKAEVLQEVFQVDDDKPNTLLKATLKHPPLKAVLRHRVLWRQLDFCRNVVRAENATTGRLHPDYNQLEQVSGTLSLSRTQVEVLARLAQATNDSELCLLGAATGNALLKVSLPFLELRLLAYYANEKLLQKEFENGECPVRLLADAIAQAKLETAYSNSVLAKALWHGQGVLNQNGAYLQRSLYSELGIVLDLKQLKSLQALLPSRYPDLKDFHSTTDKWDYGNRATLLGSIRLWRQASQKEARGFVVWTSHNEILKQCILLCSTSNAVFIDREHFYLETPAQTAQEIRAELQKTLEAQLPKLFPQITIQVKAEIVA